MKKKIISLLMCAAMCIGLCSCGGGSGSDSDWDYIQNKGSLVVGITYYEPMNYLDENGELTGFETEFTKAVCEKLGVTPEFQVIEWSKKEVELQSRTIDAIWNGLTVSDERREQMAFSVSYIVNKQVVIAKAENADKYTDTASMAGTSIAFEGGSAGETAATSDDTLKNCKLINCEAQKDALMEVKAGTADLGIIDYVMALASVGEGTDYSDSKIIESGELTPEEYAIGIRLEDKETLAKINGAIDELAKDGTLGALAEKYGLADVYALG
ncbi:MAG: transporter substrate-binding domain-containing protein [Oscillospiraceae bacterium]|nr:transporter substrate-binding domain-containing protein [Oscillospiraceae bacterium]